MKMLRTTILTTLLLAVLSVSAPAQSKIATVDMGKLFNDYWKTKQAEVVLNKRAADLQKEIKAEVSDLDKAQADYNQLLDQANDPALSAEERAKRRQTAADKLKAINAAKANIDQDNRRAQSQLLDQRQRMTANLVNEIHKIVGDKAKAGGYTLVVNSTATDSVVYSSGDDLTDAVLKQLNAGTPIDLTQPDEVAPITTLLNSTNGPALDLNPH
ncbi:MAG: OmpH family outer membrane protein [Verrucomicrobiota bacterium]|jgi:outer membrane protein